MEHFGGDVCWCATALDHLLLRDDGLRETEIGDLDPDDLVIPFAFPHQNVFRLEVSMDYSARLQIFDRLEQLKHDDGDLFLIHIVRVDIFE